MASTYSPSLRIELIGAGDQAGTWNTTTNTNLGTLLETAIAGNVSVSVTSANQALTAVNGVTDQARQAILTLTTTTTAAFAVYAPPQPKQYIVYNSTAYAATVYNSTVLGNTTAAGLGVIVPAGKKLLVFSDAVNFYVADVSNLTGAVTSVGNVTSLGSFTSAQLLGALTDETGTGAAVFATSPTLVTPALGTPTSGTLDNCTSNTETFGTSNTQLATTAFVQAALQALHPVGSIYTNTVSTNPGTLFGFGTWVAFGAGRVMVGVGGAFSAGATGGSADAIVVSHTHTGSTSTIGDHSHTVNSSGESGNTGLDYVAGARYFAGTTPTNPAGSHAHSFTTDTSGVSGTNANLPPYIVVYMWNRTA